MPSITISRAINVAALLALVGVLAGSLWLQFGVGEQPCPLCLVQRSAMIGLAVGPALNLLWGVRPRNYAISILAAVAGSFGSIRQILLHIADPADPGYGPAFLGYHLYTWALITFVVGIVGCAVLLLWEAPFAAGDKGVLGRQGALRAVSLGAIIWVFVDLVVITVSIVPECGLGMCPDDPPASALVIDGVEWVAMALIGLGSFVAGFVIDRRMRSRMN